jgi:serpin B
MKAMGIKDAFTRNADFSTMSSSPLYLGLLDQYTSIEVDEKGTEAAAVTVGGMLESAAPPSESTIIPFHMNRPFAFIIKEKSTGTILFMGKVTKL